MHGPTGIIIGTIFASVILIFVLLEKLPDSIKMIVFLAMLAIGIFAAIAAYNKYVDWHNRREEKRQHRDQ